MTPFFSPINDSAALTSVTDSFSAWLDSHMKKRAGGGDVPARVVVVMALLERLRESPALSSQAHLTQNQQQLIDHNRFVKEALERHQIASPLTEFGRRASNVGAWIDPLLEWLSGNGFEEMAVEERGSFIDVLGKIASDRIQIISQAQPLVVRFNKGTAKAVIADLLDQAQEKNRAKDVAEYLVGAKLQMIFGESSVVPKNVNTPSQHADFVVGDTAIEVTVNSPDQRHLDQIKEVLANTTLEFWLKVRHFDREKWQNVVDGSVREDLVGRVFVNDIESFLCQNMSEKGGLAKQLTEDALLTLFRIYNDRWLPTAGTAGIVIVNADPE